MANSKSARKRVRTAERNRIRNKNAKSAIRTAIKRVHEAVTDAQGADTINERLSAAYGKIDGAILKGIMHKNSGSRYKSRLASAVNKAAAAK